MLRCGRTYPREACKCLGSMTAQEGLVEASYQDLSLGLKCPSTPDQCGRVRSQEWGQGIWG
jgi:hypothetical protein